MPVFDMEWRDVLWLLSLVVTIVLAYGRVRGEIRHLDDTKADQRELVHLGEELRGTLAEIRTSLVRLEANLSGIVRSFRPVDGEKNS
ncbi:hypothetical protein GF324_07335 [bacterium]|nr:hypothetical protein [bacterium]